MFTLFCFLFCIFLPCLFLSLSGGLSPAAAVSSLDSALSSGDETVILGALNAVSSLSLVTRNEETQRRRGKKGGKTKGKRKNAKTHI